MLLKDVELFVKHASLLDLRNYQKDPAVAIVESVIKRQRLILRDHVSQAVREE